MKNYVKKLSLALLVALSGALSLIATDASVVVEPAKEVVATTINVATDGAAQVPKVVFRTTKGQCTAICKNIYGFLVQSAAIFKGLWHDALNVGVTATGFANQHPRLTLLGMGAVGAYSAYYMYPQPVRRAMGHMHRMHCANPACPHAHYHAR